MAFRPCELRRFDADWVCDAAGIPLKSLAEPGETIEDVCARCRVPDELSRRPCLFMTPVKLWHEERWTDLFGCHWYHTVVREDMLRDTEQCYGCVDWFPRPPRAASYRFLERAAVMREAMRRRLTEPPPPPRFVFPRQPLAPPSWWKRVVQRATAWR